MLSKSRRISRSEVKAFTGNNHRNMAFHGPFLSLFLYKKTDLSPSQFSFSVSKKVAARAVSRNALRRRGYAALARKIDLIQPGYYCMFSFKKGASGMTSADTAEQVIFLLRKAGLVSAD